MDDFYGNNMKFFIGVVKEVVDETYVRVRIFGIHPTENQTNVDDSDLPLALVTYPTTGGQAGSGAISHNLQTDSWVFGFFADPGFCQQPVIISVINGTDYSSSTYKSQGGKFVGEGSSDSSNENPNIDITETTNIPGDSNIAKSYNFITQKLQAEGSSTDLHLHASAVCGVLMLETTNINPATVGGYRGRAWGICQWLNPRRAQLFAKFGQTKRLDQQLDFMWWELNNTETNAKKKWLSATNLPDAVAGFCAFERAEEWQNGKVNRAHGNFKKRLQFAYKIYNSMKPTT